MNQCIVDFCRMNHPSFNWADIELPVKSIIPQLLKSLENETTIILQAPPGAGKSTLVPLALLEQSRISGKKVIMLEPRRLAAKSIAQRMADLLGETVGETVGYRIRFESRVSDKTTIEVITEGILTRMLLSDNALEDVGCILFDEFHERSIHADLALALSRESQSVLRSDLKIIIMSATLDAASISTKLNAPVIESEGKQFPVAIKHTEDVETFNLVTQCSRVIRKAYQETDGDILVFLPGQKEILDIQNELKKETRLSVFPLYGALPFSQQWRAIQPMKDGRRRIVLATSIAETSLTIEGISTVVDTGWGRGVSYDPGSGLTRLHTYRISMDEANQRAGRAGRLRSGTCYRMWTTATEHRMEMHRKPEILTQDLSSLVLSLFAWGIQYPEELFWLDSLPTGTYHTAIDLLEQLGALEDQKITTLGKRMSQLPCHPRIAHMLIESYEVGDFSLACDIAALIEERDPLRDSSSVDVDLRLQWIRRKRAEKSSEKSFVKLDSVAKSYASLFDESLSTGTFDPYEPGILLSYAYPERIAGSQGNRSGRFQLANGHVVRLPKEDDLYAASWIVVANMDARDSLGKVFLAAQINPQDLASQVKEKEVIQWNDLSQELVTEKQMKVGGLVLSSQPLSQPDPEKCKEAILSAIRKTKGSLLNIDETVENLFNRIQLLKTLYPEHNFPSTDYVLLLNTAENWLAPYLKGIKTGKELKKLNLSEIVTNSLLNYQQQQLLTQLAPEKIKVPSGSLIQIQYRNNDIPILAVRLQEMFGCEDTPTICDGRQPLLIHLLSPGFKPVQVTSDLKNFWKNTYFEVKKELKGRYPKHVWPDNPLEESPTNRAKKRN